MLLFVLEAILNSQQKSDFYSGIFLGHPVDLPVVSHRLIKPVLDCCHATRQGIKCKLLGREGTNISSDFNTVWLALFDHDR